MRNFFCLLAVLISYNISAQVRNNGEAVKKFDSVNNCKTEFADHSQLAKITEQQNTICSLYKSDSVYIKNQLWKDFFGCFDNMSSKKNKDKFFFRTCFSNSRFKASRSYKKCAEVIEDEFKLNASHFCVNKTKSNMITDNKFLTCTDSLKNTNINTTTAIDKCSSEYGRDQVFCRINLLPYFDSKTAWSECNGLFGIEKDRVNKRGFKQCMKSSKALTLTSKESLNLCSSFDSKGILSCIDNAKDAFGLNTAISKCNDYSFRQSNKSKDFGKCIVKVQGDGLTKSESIDICSVSKNEISLIANSKSFDQCIKKDFSQSIDVKSKYQICTIPKVTSLMSDNYYKECLNKGFESGMLDYFSLKSKNKITNSYVVNSKSNSDDINAWSYIFKDCVGDHKYKHKSRRYNNFIRVYKDYNIHTNQKFNDKIKIGGLSAVRVSPDNRQLYFLSDDRGFNTNTKSRLYTYNFNFDEKDNLVLNEDKIITLQRRNKDKSNVSIKSDIQIASRVGVRVRPARTFRMDMDPEGFDFNHAGELIVSSELDDLTSNDFISIFSQDGVAIENIPLNDEFKPVSTSKKKCRKVKRQRTHSNTPKNIHSGGIGHIENTIPTSEGRLQITRSDHSNDQDDSYYESCHYERTEKGFQANKSLESLSLSPDKRFLFTANEDSLSQDKDQDDHGTRGKRVRIIRFKENNNGKFKEEGQFYYRLENEEDNGLVEILSVNENLILTLERSWDGKKITSRIFAVDLTNAENIILKSDSKTNYAVRSVTKKLIIDLDDLKYELSPGFRKLDNIEGLAFGPTLPNGKESLILVSDNNFRQSQRTMLLLLEVRMDKIKNLFR